MQLVTKPVNVEPRNLACPYCKGTQQVTITKSCGGTQVVQCQCSRGGLTLKG